MRWPLPLPMSLARGLRILTKSGSIPHLGTTGISAGPPMSRFFVSREATAFVRSQPADDFFEGHVYVLFGPSARRVQHVCLGVRDSAREVVADARRDAMALLKRCAQGVRL